MSLQAQRLTSIEDPLFSAVWKVYEASFPAMERRTRANQERVMAASDYRLDAWSDGERFVGIMGWWDFGWLRYVEHLALDVAVRSEGMGSRLLRQWMEGADSPVLLEIDPPVDEISRRRLGFYQRLGYIENPMDHWHPYYQGRPASGMPNRVPLRVLTWPRAISGDEYAAFFAVYQRDVWASIGDATQ